jgi:NAD+ diphosphatase
VFVPLVEAPGPSEGDALVLAVRGSTVCLHDVADPPGPSLFLGVLEGRHCWAVDADEDGDVDGDAFYADLFRLHASVDEVTWALAGRAVQLVEWARTHRFCGRCGTPTEAVPKERARRCPACGLLAFPRLSPAVIALIERDDGRALLGRNARFPAPMWSCLAGFVEPGETLEAAVRREVKEEVGIDVGDVAYWGSQPWPFPNSLMLGFQGRYAGGEIECDGVEIAEAGWFSPDDLPQIPPKLSIARWLIDDWVQRVS